MGYAVIVLIYILILNIHISTPIKYTLNGTLMECEKRPADYLESNWVPYHVIDKCHRKIRMTLNIENEEKTPSAFQFASIIEVSDSKTGVQLRLLNPILLRLQQDQVLLAYPFKYISAVNGKASEVVINYENRKNYTGCDDTSKVNPTCGIKHEHGIAVSYSEGFCCFCPEAPVKEKQTRGGQDCSIDVGDPGNFEKQSYKASAHCLQMDEVWYTVSHLNEPIIIHETYVQVYNERHLINGSTVWVALTHDNDFELGIRNPYEYDENKTIVISYFTENPKNSAIVIPFEDRRLFVPQPMPALELTKLPAAVKNGASDFLLIPKDLIEPDGSTCDTAGISYAAFAKQEDRCENPKETCLKNQPLDFWEEDNEKRLAGEKGTYILENYGTPYKDAIIVNRETNEHWLALEYYSKQQTILTIEIAADDIITLSVGKEAQISSVVTTNFHKKIEFYINVLNLGLSPAEFSVQVNKCSFKVPDSDEITKMIPPQLSYEFVLSSDEGSIELDEKFDCMVEVSNEIYGIIAKRKVIVKPKGRCICNMHCLCTCLGESLKCVSMKIKDYQLGGFRGSLPVLSAKPPYKPWMRRHPFLAFISFFLFLLALGLIKASIDFAGCQPVGNFGMKKCFYQPKKIKEYSEPNLKYASVIYDIDGYPLDPDTSKRVRVYGGLLTFLLNSIFFFIWPCIYIWGYMDEKRRSDFGYDRVREDSSFGSMENLDFIRDQETPNSIYTDSNISPINTEDFQEAVLNQTATDRRRRSSSKAVRQDIKDEKDEIYKEEPVTGQMHVEHEVDASREQDVEREADDERDEEAVPVTESLSDRESEELPDVENEEEEEQDEEEEGQQMPERRRPLSKAAKTWNKGKSKIRTVTD